MAREVLPWVGMAVGAYFGNPQLGFMIGSLVGNAVDPERIKGPSIGEAQTQTSREGVFRPIVLGIGCVAGNIINRGPEVIRIQKERQGKGGPVIESERRYRTFAIRICEGPIAGLLRIWENETLVYDARPGSGIEQESVQYSGKFRFYNGTETQLPDPDLEKFLGPGNASAYRGSCYIVFPNYDLTEMRDMIPQYRFEVASVASLGEAVGTIATGLDSLGSAGSTSSATGIFWEGAVNISPSYTDSASIGGRIIVWGLFNVHYTDELGEAWNGPYGSLGGVGGQKQGYTRTDTLIIPGGLGQGVFITTDGQFLQQNNSITSNNCAINDEVAISVSIYDPACDISFDKGATWYERSPPPIQVTGSKYISCNSDVFNIGGASIFNIGKPAIATTSNNAMNWFPIEFTASAGSRVSFVIPCGDSSWVALMNNGEIWYSIDSILWEKANQELGLVPAGLAFNGIRVIAAGSSGGMATIMTAELSDLSEWTTRETNFVGIYGLVSGTAEISDVDSEKIPLSSIVDFCHKRVYHPESWYDTSEISSIDVDGVVFADGYAAREAIAAVTRDFYTDTVECDEGGGYKINYVRRGKPSFKTITVDDLVDEPEDIKREDPLERPRVLHLHFQSPIVGYAPAKASIQRISPDAKVSGEASIQTPITYTDQNEAWRVADIMMRQAWTEVAGRRTFSLAGNNYDVVPTDVLTVSLRGRVTRERVLRSEYIDGVIKIESIADRQSNYRSNVVGPILPEPTPPPPSIAGVTMLAILDIPAILDTHDSLGYYVAATGPSPGWQGAMVQISEDMGASYQNLIPFNRSTATVMGEIVNTVSRASEYYTDTTNEVIVNLYRDSEIESLTQQQFLSEGGAFALEWSDSSGTHWEVMQYRDAEQQTDGSWRLSYLARGRLDTDTAEHLPGSRFVMLDGVQFVRAEVSMLGQEITHRAVSSGTSPEIAVPQTITYSGQAQREWPVAHIFASEDSGDLSIDVVPRHRFGTEDRPVRSINWDGYRYKATDGVSTQSVDSTSPSIIIDASGWSAPITVTVSQINRITGEGPQQSEVIP